jgi:hypothetical protein
VSLLPPVPFTSPPVLLDLQALFLVIQHFVADPGKD